MCTESFDVCVRLINDVLMCTEGVHVRVGLIKNMLMCVNKIDRCASVIGNPARRVLEIALLVIVTYTCDTSRNNNDAENFSTPCS